MSKKTIIIDQDTVKSVNNSTHCSDEKAARILKKLAKNICYMRFELLDGTEIIFDTSGAGHYKDEED